VNRLSKLKDLEKLSVKVTKSVLA